MVLGNTLSFLWTLGFCLVTSQVTPSLPSIEDQNFIEDCVDIHNELRRRVQPPAANMKFMSWDEELAKIAKAWVNKCIYDHNPCLEGFYGCHAAFRTIGENIWLGPFFTFTPKTAIGRWYNESRLYNYSTQRCSRVCGHYTQVVWAKSYKIGCAIAACPNLADGNASFFACDYTPAGNYLHQLPYIEGPSCSKCEEEEICKEKLCHEQKKAKNENTGLAKPQEFPNWQPQGKASQWTAYYPLCLVFILLRMF